MSPRIAIIAHTGKTLGGGLDELRRLLAEEGNEQPLWYEVPKSRKAPKKVRQALTKGADLLFIWGGDGMVQRCLDTMVREGADARLAVVPAGTANLFAHNLGIPIDLAECVHIGLHGRSRRLDVGRFNGEHFAVMAGVGFDARMIRGVDGKLKRRLGRMAYVWTGLREIGVSPVHARVKLDGSTWFKGDATCVLIGNVSKVFGEIEVFTDAAPDDGWLDVGVTTASNPVQWSTALARIGAGHADRSRYVHTARAHRISVRLARPVRYELDGGARTSVTKVKVRVVPASVTVCVPA